jgi:hypothetical protein
MNRNSTKMVALLGFVLPVLCASASFASGVRWKRIVGVIAAPDDGATPADEHVNNPVGNIGSGTSRGRSEAAVLG